MAFETIKLDYRLSAFEKSLSIFTSALISSGITSTVIIDLTAKTIKRLIGEAFIVECEE